MQKLQFPRTIIRAAELLHPTHESKKVARKESSEKNMPVMKHLLSLPSLALSMTLLGLGSLNLNAFAAEAGDSIAVPVGSQSAELRSTVLLPERGQSMESVRDRLGSPEVSETVGKPAITKWQYQDMTVYFEDKTVLRAVVHPNFQKAEPTAVATESSVRQP
ncbi:hypothetical protein [Endozoicomonas sp. SESOKO4]|uniref:hypothetical protein n=1 Tax=Endozoicomonas sp. SESOKO4 TaxID=2828745 RepID=UPI002148D1BF|nr:hypothetical protein [Endozoicomonas sp. SESOKO4]